MLRCYFLQTAALAVTLCLLGCSEPEQPITEVFQGEAKAPTISANALGRPVGTPNLGTTSTIFLAQANNQHYIIGAAHPFGSRSDLKALTQLQMLNPAGQMAVSDHWIPQNRVAIATLGYTADDYACFQVTELHEKATPLDLSASLPLLEQPVWIFAYDRSAYEPNATQIKRVAAIVQQASNHRIVLRLRERLPDLFSGSPVLDSSGSVVGICVYVYYQNNDSFVIAAPMLNIWRTILQP